MKRCGQCGVPQRVGKKLQWRECWGIAPRGTDLRGLRRQDER